MLTVIGIAAGAALLYLLLLQWLRQRPQVVIVLPAVAGWVVGTAVFLLFVKSVRPVAQAEAFIGLALGGAAGGTLWWKLRRAVEPWLAARASGQGA